MIKKILKHKGKIFLMIVAISMLGYWWHAKVSNDDVAPRYVLATVKRSTLTVSVSGSGQVSATNQIDLKPEVSGMVIGVSVKNGQEVKAGEAIVQLDASDALKTARDARLNLEAAQLALEKLNKPVDNLSLIQAENAIALAQESKQKAQDDFKKAQDDGFNIVANAFLDLPTIMAGLHDVLLGTDIGTSQWNADFYADVASKYDTSAARYRDDALHKYQAARAVYNTNFDNYKSTNRSSNVDNIQSIFNETYATTKDIAEAVKSANNLIQFYKDKLAEHGLKTSVIADTHLSALNTYTSKTNTHLLNLLTIQNTLQSDKQTILASDRTIAEKNEALAKLKSGPDGLDIKTQELVIRQRLASMADARVKLTQYVVRAPIGGVIATVGVKKGDFASASTLIATIVGKQKIAEISLNEIDVAKIKIGEKATLSFDAIDGLNFTGEVIEIDTLGTVTQGVVSYAVKISFDTQDDRVKSGMSVAAAIITDVKPDVLIVSNSALKSQGAQNYVEMFDGPLAASVTSAQGVASPMPPRQQPVQVGIANDTDTEVVSGLKEGDQIVVRVISAPATKTTTQTIPSLLPTSGGVRGFSGGQRSAR